MVTINKFKTFSGVEIMYDMYNPTIQKFEVLRLEKRLDDELLYLRDALPEYSTFPFDLTPENLPEGAEVPINPLQVRESGSYWYFENRTVINLSMNVDIIMFHNAVLCLIFLE